jgi:NTE family protein
MQRKGRSLKSVGRIGLALGSGSARGWSHIGVIRALNEAGIRVDYVAGTSIGALVGAVYAAGQVDKLEAWALQLEWKQILSFMDVVLPKSGLIDGRKIADLVRQRVHAKNIEDLPIPFGAIATDLRTGHEVVLRKGDIVEAVRASISLPGILTPVEKDHAFLIDGGLVNPLPVNTARSMGADFVIAVDLNSDIVPKKRTRHSPPTGIRSGLSRIRHGLGVESAHPLALSLRERIASLDLSVVMQIKTWLEPDLSPDIFEVMSTSIRIMQSQITRSNLKANPPDLLIQPNLGHINLMEFHRTEEAIAEGYRAAQSQLAGWLQMADCE